jgi:hypothetical protein
MEALLGLPEGVSVDVNEDVLLLSAPLLPAEQVLVLFDTAVATRRRIPRVVSSLFPPRPRTRGARAPLAPGALESESTGSDVA